MTEYLYRFELNIICNNALSQLLRMALYCMTLPKENKKMKQTELPRLPKSSKKIIAALADYSNLTQKQLIVKVDMPAKTVRYALKRLTEEGVISQIPNLSDMRSVYYSLNPDMAPNELDAHIESARQLMLAEA